MQNNGARFTYRFDGAGARGGAGRVAGNTANRHWARSEICSDQRRKWTWHRLLWIVWSAYAFSGAGVLPRLPLLRLVPCAITFAYVARAVAFPAIMPMFPGNSMTFWLTSSAICAVFGIVHLIGRRQAWAEL